MFSMSNVDYVGQGWRRKICHDLVKRLVTNVEFVCVDA